MKSTQQTFDHRSTAYLPDYHRPFLNSVTLPKLVQACWAAYDPEGFFFSISSRTSRDFFTVELPGFSTIHVTGSANGAKELMSAPPQVFKMLTGSPIDSVLGPNSMMVKDGKKHQRQRKMIMPCLGPGPMKSLKKSFAKVAIDALSSMQVPSETNLADLMQDLTLSIVVETIFGVQDQDFKKKFCKTIKEFVSLTTPSLLLIPNLRSKAWPPWRKFLRAQAKLDACLFEQISKLKQSPEDGNACVIKTMMLAKDENGQALSLEELRDELRTLIVAGHETTAMAMTWAFYYILIHPKIYAKVMHEINSCKSLLDDSMPFLDAVFKEALRIKAIPPFAFRTLGQDYSILNHQLKAGDNVALSMILLHHDERVFKNPRKFIPERFLDHEFGAYEFLPFGSGARRCIGSYFAQTEMRILAAYLLKGAKFELLSKKAPRLVLRHINAGPDRPIHIRIIKK
ncbi:MAG: cytochrome P450 [Oligoflexales bacterium]